MTAVDPGNKSVPVQITEGAQCLLDLHGTLTIPCLFFPQMRRQYTTVRSVYGASKLSKGTLS